MHRLRTIGIALAGIGVMAAAGVVLYRMPLGDPSADAAPGRLPPVQAHHSRHVPTGVVLSGLQSFVINQQTVATVERKELVAKHYWHARYVEIQVEQDRLVGADGHHYAPGYMSVIRTVVFHALRLGLTVAINPQTETTPGYGLAEPLPTYATHVFWHKIMHFYAGNRHVIFDLFNEPRPKCHGLRRPGTCVWGRWLDTMQPLVTEIRARADNRIWAQGVWWGSTFDGLPRPLAGGNICYDYHHPGAPWSYEMTPTTALWNRAFGYLADDGYCVVNGEFANYRGSFDFTHPRRTMGVYLAYLTAHHIGLLAWTLMPGALNSSLDLRSESHEPEGDGVIINEWFRRQYAR